MSGRAVAGALLGALAVYTVALFIGELATSQQAVRVFFTDVRIPGSKMWFGLNTTLCVALMWGSAGSFAAAWRANRMWDRAPERARFFVSQVLVFLYLGADDRFTFHETIGGALHHRLAWFDDSFILLGLGVLELALLVGLMPRALATRTALRWLAAGAVCYAISTAVDGLVPRDLPGRLALEDLSKTWSVTCLLAWAWTVLGIELEELRRSPPAPS